MLCAIWKDGTSPRIQYPAEEDGERSKNGVWIEENIAHFHAASGWWRHNDRS
jgi:hypothetical protein